MSEGGRAGMGRGGWEEMAGATETGIGERRVTRRHPGAARRDLGVTRCDGGAVQRVGGVAGCDACVMQ